MFQATSVHHQAIEEISNHKVHWSEHSVVSHWVLNLMLSYLALQWPDDGHLSDETLCIIDYLTWYNPFTVLLCFDGNKLVFCYIYTTGWAVLQKIRYKLTEIL
jgi:hypothetical protein